MSCCLQPDVHVDERTTILESFQDKFRQGRKQTRTKTQNFMISTLKVVFCSSGYWVPSSCCYTYVLLLVLISFFQLAYDLVTVFHCPNFDCRFLIKVKNKTANPTRDLQNATYTFASSAGLFSFTLMIISLYIAGNRRRNALGPRTILTDLGRRRAYILGSLLSFFTLLYLASVGVFFYITRDEVKAKYYCILVTGVGSQFVIQWTGIVACFVFGACALSLGSFAKDVQRRIGIIQTTNINSAIVIHREFASIVGDTVKAFSVWFVVHWFLYGVTTILALIVVVRHFGEESNIMKKMYLVLFLAVHLLMFVIPCVFAAYITTACGGIPAKMNNITEEEWPEDHIFRDRQQLQLFVSYASQSSVCFKVGRITFTSTLAWVSFFFGFSGLLFRFF